MVTIKHEMPIEGTTARIPIRPRPVEASNPQTSPASASEPTIIGYNNGKSSAATYQADLALFELQKNEQMRLDCEHKGREYKRAGRNPALKHYQMQIMLLEQQNKKQPIMARQAQHAIAQNDTTSPYGGYGEVKPKPNMNVGNNALQEYQMELMRWQPQQKNGPMTAREEQGIMESTSTGSQTALPTGFLPGRKSYSKQYAQQKCHGKNHALTDYNMQLQLLERQNKKRLMMARQEQDTQSVPASSGSDQHGNNHALQNYHMQLALLEQQNKERLMMARQGQNALVLLEQPDKKRFRESKQEQEASQNDTPYSYVRSDGSTSNRMKGHRMQFATSIETSASYTVAMTAGSSAQERTEFIDDLCAKAGKENVFLDLSMVWAASPEVYVTSLNALQVAKFQAHPSVESITQATQKPLSSISWMSSEPENSWP